MTAPVKVAGWLAECQGCGCITFVTWPRELPRDLSTLCHCPGVTSAAPLVYLEAGEDWPAECADRPSCEYAQRLREPSP